MNRQQRRRQEQLDAKLSRKGTLAQHQAVRQQAAHEQMTKRDYVAYSFAMGVAMEAVTRTKGIGAARKREFVSHIKAIEADLSIERNDGDAPDGPFTQDLAEEIGIRHLGLPKEGTA
jgi:hypothetical protein